MICVTKAGVRAKRIFPKLKECLLQIQAESKMKFFIYLGMASTANNLLAHLTPLTAGKEPEFCFHANKANLENNNNI